MSWSRRANKRFYLPRVEPRAERRVESPRVERAQCLAQRRRHRQITHARGQGRVRGERLGMTHERQVREVVLEEYGCRSAAAVQCQHVEGAHELELRLERTPAAER